MTNFNVKCPVCEEDIKRDCLKVYFFNNENYKLYHCLRCGIQFWHPLKIIPGFYEDKTDFARFGLYQTLEADIISENQKSFFKNFPIKTGDLLDVGCGNGRFLAKAQEAGFSVCGTDLNEGRIKAAKEKFGIKNVYAMGLNEFVEYAQKNGMKFDVATFFDVFEHQDDPKKFIALIKKILKPGGWVVGTVPNRERPWADRERDKLQTGDVPPHHLLWFSKDSLTNIFSYQGFEIKNYSIPVSVFFLSAYLDGLIFGNSGRKLKVFARKLLLGKNTENLSIEVAEKIETKKIFQFKILRFLKKLRNYIFSPLALIILKFYNKRGSMIYFQGSLKN